MVAISIAEKPARGGSRMRWLKLGFMACVACVQLWTQGSLTSYAMALHQSAERHASLQVLMRLTSSRPHGYYYTRIRASVSRAIGTPPTRS